ncbi:MAG: PD-(D/E)XK nuclease domain-containing protein, partial [Myxococcota bacterium]
FSELNNPGIYGVLDQPYASWFGFTEHEANQLLQQTGHSDRLELVRQAYDGYRFGADQPVMIYNPWSVINDLCKPTAKPGLHWVNTSDNYLIQQLLTRANTDTKKGLHQLLSASTHYSSTQTIKEHVPLRFLENDSAHLWGLLLASGYVTAASHQKKADSLEHVVQLRIPNQEVMCVYNDLLRRWLTSGAGASGTALLDALVAGQVQEFASHFKQFALESIGYFDKSNTQPERFYHGFVLGMMHYLQDRYIVDSQRESGLGRYDLALEPKDKTLPGFVMEFKTCLGDPVLLNDTAQQALQQIQDKQYHIELAKRGVKPIIALGFAFSGKQVAIVHKTLTGASAAQQ